MARMAGSPAGVMDWGTEAGVAGASTAGTRGATAGEMVSAGAAGCGVDGSDVGVGLVRTAGFAVASGPCARAAVAKDARLRAAIASRVRCRSAGLPGEVEC